MVFFVKFNRKYRSTKWNPKNPQITPYNCRSFQESKFRVTGEWRGRRFYLHVTVKWATDDTHPVDYFAVLNLRTLVWTPLIMNQQPLMNRLTFPIKMLITPDDQLYLIQAYRDGENSVDRSQPIVYNAFNSEIGTPSSRYLEICRIPLGLVHLPYSRS